MRTLLLKTYLIVTALLLAAPVLCQQIQSTKIHKQVLSETGNYKPLENAEKSPAVSINNVTGNNQKNMAGDRRQFDWFGKLFDDLKITDICIAFFTAALALYTALLWRSTEKLWKAGEDQLTHLKESSQKELRAYVTLSGGSMRLKRDTTGNAIGVDVIIHYLNSGKTPGYSFRTRTKIEVRDAGSDYDPLEEGEAASIIGPGSADSVGPNFISFRTGEFDAIGKGTKKIYIWGRADYSDIFENPRHFFFYATNGSYVRNIDDSTGRLVWDGYALKPAERGYEAN